jgi:hypothetical protein
MTKFSDLGRPVATARMRELYYKGSRRQPNCPVCDAERKTSHSYESIARLYEVSPALVATMINEAKPFRTVCPDCGGNGYIKVPHEIYADQFDVRQCEQCSSEGEIDAQI